MSRVVLLFVLVGFAEIAVAEPSHVAKPPLAVVRDHRAVVPPLRILTREPAGEIRRTPIAVAPGTTVRLLAARPRLGEASVVERRAEWIEIAPPKTKPMPDLPFPVRPMSLPKGGGLKLRFEF